VRHVIVGGGIAGTTAAEELRKIDASAEIVLVCEEFEPLYSRVLLTHYVKGIVPREKLFLKKESWYQEQKIEWLPGTRCESIDTTNGFITISDGREIPYDRLLIATGGEPRTLPYESVNVAYFHSLGDAEHLISLLRSRAGGRGIVYGGSFIAADLIDAFLHHGAATVAAFRGPWMFRRTLDADSGELINDALHRANVDVRANVDDLDSLGATTGDIVSIGAGMEPDLGWIRDAGIAVGKGVLTNARLETNVKDAYVAGDIAEFDDLAVGRQRTAGNWTAAREQGLVAARNMAGARDEYRAVSSYAAKLAGLDIVFIGDTDRTAADEVRVIGSHEAGGVTQLFVRGGRIVGATLVNRNQDRQPATKAIQTGLRLSDYQS